MSVRWIQDAIPELPKLARPLNAVGTACRECGSSLERGPSDNERTPSKQKRRRPEVASPFTGRIVTTTIGQPVRNTHGTPIAETPISTGAGKAAGWQTI
jgi:hypothetical protein